VTRVLFLQQQPCIRTLKYAAGLRSSPGTASYELGFACQGQTLTGWYGTGDELFDRWWHLGAEPSEELRRVVEEFRPDVIHSHNLPDRLTVLALDVVSGAVPVVHDTHDLQSLRRTPYEDGFAEPADPAALERDAVRGCDALVVVSEEMRAEIDARHGLPAHTLVFPNYALERDLPSVLPPPDRSRTGPPRLVYQGTLSTNGGHYDLREIFVAIVSEGVSLDVYPARPVPEYEELAAAHPGLTCHAMLPPQKLLQTLPEYDFGWAGFNASLNRPHLDTALPNKAYEYLGCGLPIVTLDHRALRRLVDDEGVGISVDAVSGLGARLAQVDVVGLRGRVAALRGRVTIEANIDRVVRLYDTVTGS
jgi:glycosyltransferase involved in cell wall biosynthesis